VKSTLLAIALLLAAANVSAQTIYMKVSPAGHKSFSDTPDSTPDPEAAPEGEKWRAPAGTMARGSRRAAVVNANEARRRLGQAQLDRKQGSHPLPRELASGQGATVVHHSYWRRQENLRLMVEQAQRRSNETSTLLLAQH
jgi:hypothetical protein